MVATDPGTAASRADVSRRFEAWFDAPAARPPRLGIEQEYGLFEGDRQIDFGPVVDRRDLGGLPLHPTNPRAHQLPSGLLLLADGVVAEAASPPVLLGAGFARSLERWAAQGRAALASSLEPGERLIGASTHLSVEVPNELNDRICDLYASTFAPALMLLLDRSDSPGLLIRPRPSRAELCGEFSEGARLRAASAFAAGSVLAVQAHLEHDAPLPPSVAVEVESARQRHGWYVDRTAFGPDLYEDGRTAELQLTAGGTTTAQTQLEAAWHIARAALLDAGAAAEDLVDADRVVAGDIPLPSEARDLDDRLDPEPIDPAARYAGLLDPPAPPGYAVRPLVATWDFAAFEVRDRSIPDRAAVVSVPESQLDTFLNRAADPALAEVVDGYLEGAPENRVLDSSRQTEAPGIYDSVEPNPQLLPPDRMGVGAGEVSRFRPGKRDTPPSGGGGGVGIAAAAGGGLLGGLPWGWIGAAAAAGAVAIGVLMSGGGDSGPADATSPAGGNATASSGGNSGGGSSGIPAAPLIVHPCDVLSAAEVSSLLGVTGLVADRDLFNDRRAICTYRSPEAAGGLHVEVQRNSSAQGFLDEFRRQRPDARVTPVDWNEEGELRVYNGGDSASLWAYVISDDPLGRDIFIWIAGASGDASEQVVEIAGKLRTAILEKNKRPTEP